MHKTTPLQSFTGSLADKVVRCDKIKQQQADRPDIFCEGVKLDNVYLMKYLGTIFTADGDQLKDISVRI